MADRNLDPFDPTPPFDDEDWDAPPSGRPGNRTLDRLYPLDEPAPPPPPVQGVPDSSDPDQPSEPDAEPQEVKINLLHLVPWVLAAWWLAGVAYRLYVPQNGLEVALVALSGLSVAICRSVVARKFGWERSAVVLAAATASLFLADRYPAGLVAATFGFGSWVVVRYGDRFR